MFEEKYANMTINVEGEELTETELTQQIEAILVEKQKLSLVIFKYGLMTNEFPRLNKLFFTLGNSLDKLKKLKHTLVQNKYLAARKDYNKHMNDLHEVAWKVERGIPVFNRKYHHE